MIPPWREILDGIDGALGLAVRNPAAPTKFRLSMEGFWHSFAAMVLVAPVWLLMTLEQFARLAENAEQAKAPPLPPMAVSLMLESVFYFLDWVLFPVVMISVCRTLDLMNKYVGFIIARNWMYFVTWFVLFFPVYFLFKIEGLHDVFVWLVAALSFVLQCTFLWRVTESMLGLKGGTVAVIVATDIVLKILMAMLSAQAYLAFQP